MAWRVRRVVTGHDAKGRSIFLTDGLAPNVKEMESMPGVALTDLWETATSPASNEGSADAVARPVKLEPPKAGTLLRIVEFPPDSQWRGRADAGRAFDSIGAGHAPDHSSDDPMRHKTNTVDYIIVLKGEIYALMDEGETLLKAGDILISAAPIIHGACAAMSPASSPPSWSAQIRFDRPVVRCTRGRRSVGAARVAFSSKDDRAQTRTRRRR